MRCIYCGKELSTGDISTHACFYCIAEDKNYISNVYGGWKDGYIKAINDVKNVIDNSNAVINDISRYGNIISIPVLMNELDKLLNKEGNTP